jgi:hypothetical protein
MDEAAVRRDLFRQHFDSLAAGAEQGGAGAAAGAPPADQARQSITARFRAERASMAGLPPGSKPPLQQAAAGSVLGAAAAAAPAAPAAAAAPADSPFQVCAAATAELMGGSVSALEAGAEGAGSPARVKHNGFIQPRAQQPPLLCRSTSEPLLELGKAARPSNGDSEGGEHGEVGAAGRGAPQPAAALGAGPAALLPCCRAAPGAAHEARPLPAAPLPQARLWRRGQMDDELARMRNQLDNLHQQFRAQSKSKQQQGSPGKHKAMVGGPGPAAAAPPLPC